MQPEIECFIINEYYHLLAICKKYTKNDDWASELLHEVLLQIYEKKEINVVLDWDNINRYIIHIITINWCSKKSPFYMKIKKFSMNDIQITEALHLATEEYNIDDDTLIELMEQEYGDLDLAEKIHFQTYLLTGTLRQTAEQYNSTTSKVWHNHNSTKQTIKNNIFKKLN